MSPPFQVAKDAGRLIVFLPVLHPDSASSWRTLLGNLVAAGHKNIVVDGSAMPYLDSLGLAEIVRSYTFCSRCEGSLTLNNMSKATRGLFEITRLSTILTLSDVDYSRLPRVELSADDLSPIQRLP